MKHLFCLFLMIGILLGNMHSAQCAQGIVRIGCVLPAASAANPIVAHRYYERCLDEMAKYTRWNYRLIDVSAGDAFPALERGLLDVILPVENTNNPNFVYCKLADFFETVPVYAAAKKENANLIWDLDAATHSPGMQNTGYDLLTFRENYLRTKRQIVTFNAREIQYIDSAPTFKCVIYKRRPPYADFDNDGQAVGIYPDIIRAIGMISGLRFNFVEMRSYSDALQALREGSADIMMDAYTNDGILDDFRFTTSVFAEEFAFVERIGTKKENSRQEIALACDIPPVYRYMQQEYEQWRITSARSLRDALDVVNSGEVDMAALDSLTLAARHPLMLFPSLTVSGKYTLSIPRSIVISPHRPRILQEILNKSIMRMEYERIEQITARHTGEMEGGISFEYILYYYPLQFGLTLGFILLLITATSFFVQYSRQMKLQQSVLSEKNLALMETLEALDSAYAEKDDYKYRSETDALTGVLNKSAIESFAKNALLRLGERSDAVFLIDLDHFKEANDTRGHQYGDIILVNFAHALKHIAKQMDGVGRFGGDEFIIYHRNATEENLTHMAEQILEAAHALDPEQRPLLSASIGIAMAPEQGKTYEELFRAADRALYYVKENGRDNFKIAPKK